MRRVHDNVAQKACASITITLEPNKQEVASVSLRTTGLLSLAALFTLAVQAPLAQADFASAQRDFDKQNYASAFYEWRQLAERGDADAQYQVAQMYEAGVGVGANQEEALKWYQLSAEQGSVPAQLSLAQLAMAGQLPDADDTQARRWLAMAAEEGDPGAQFNLGMLLLEGRGGSEDPEQAALLFEAAANQGLTAAQNNLANLYENGTGVERSPEKAFEWYSKAARDRDQYAQNSLGRHYAEGIGVERNNAWAVFWFAQAHANGNEQALENLDKSLEHLRKRTIDGSRVNIRAGKSTDYQVIAKLERGDEVSVLGESDGWSQVYIPSEQRLGWVSSSLLAD